MPDNVGESSRAWQRHLVLGLAVLAVVHSVLLVLWLAPSGPLRDTVGNARLTTYVNPYFQQSWSALEPNAQFVDEAFKLRAHIKDETTGKDRVTKWVDVTAAENGALRHGVSPARVHVMARRLATNLNGAMFGLTAKQRKLVKTNYITTAPNVLKRRLNAVDARPAVTSYMVYDQMATQFASMYAKARFGGEILEVQYLIGRRTVPKFDARGSKKLSDVPFDWFAFGYRKAYQGTFEAQSAFDSYVKK